MKKLDALEARRIEALHAIDEEAPLIERLRAGADLGWREYDRKRLNRGHSGKREVLMLTLPVSEIDDVVLALKAAGVLIVDASGRGPDQACERVIMGGKTQAVVVMDVIKTVRPGQSWQIDYPHRPTTESLSVATSVVQ